MLQAECETLLRELGKSCRMVAGGVHYCRLIAAGVAMDFIEKWFGFSPDGGDGSTELLYIIVVALVLAVIFGRKRIAKLLSGRPG